MPESPPKTMISMIKKLQQQWRYLMPLILLVMILMRLVWLQLRTYNLEGSYRGLVTIFYMTNDPANHCASKHGQSGGDLLNEFQLMKDLHAKPQYRRMASPAYQFVARSLCSNGELALRDFLRINQWAFLISTFFAICLVRLLTRSWILAMASGTILLSRGHLISNIGELNYDGMVMMLTTAWMAVLVHYFRSGSRATLVLLSIVVVIGTTFDLALAVLPLSLCMVLVLGFILRRYLLQPVMSRFRNEKRRIQTIIETGGIRLYEGGVINGVFAGLLQWIVNRSPLPDEAPHDIWNIESGMRFLGTLKQPFALWVYQNKRWLKLLGICLALIVFSAALGLLLMSVLNGYVMWRGGSHADLWAWTKDWLIGFLEPIDLHYAVCLAILAVCAVQSPALGLPNVFETVWIVVYAIVFLALTSWALDVVDLMVLSRIESSMGKWSVLAWTRSTQVLVWFEPTVLSLGLAGFYQLITIGEQASLRRKGHKNV